MLDRLVIKNFKSIGEPGVDLELKPLTLLVGPNGSGKSSILEALAIFAQSIGVDELQTWGELVKTGPSPSNVLPILDLIHRKRPGLLQFEFHKDNHGYRYIYRVDDYREVIQTVLINGQDFATEILKKFPQLRGESQVILHKDPGKPEIKLGQVDHSLVLGDYLFLWSAEETSRHSKVLEQAGLIATTIREAIKKKVFYITAFRGKVDPLMQTSAVPRWTGPNGESLVQLLSFIFGNPEYAQVKKAIQAWAKEFELESLEAGWRGDTNLGAGFDDPALKTSLHLAVAGYGSRQILTVITNLLWCGPESIFLIEEPEISLHPEAQVKVCKLFAEVIRQQKQIIATTHSHFLLSALGLPVQEGHLKPEDIAVYHVEKKPEHGTVAQRLPINEKGYIEGWIPSFAEVERRLLKEWIKTVPEE